MSKALDKIFCLMGPTASGKTGLALNLASRLPIEVISVDSAMVYRGMDIGTAKPSQEELKAVPHHLVDILDPREVYSVGQFCCDALAKISEILSRGKIPLLVGGTMLYFRSLQIGISTLPSRDEKIREKISADKDKLGLEYLYCKLQSIDPKTAASISKADSQRIQRALEVYELTGKSLSELQLANPRKPLPYQSVNIVISPANTTLLRSRIRDRFNQMISLGFVDEVNALYSRGDLSKDMPALRVVGYREIWQYLSGEIGYDELQELVPTATNQLAKRQLTWLRSWKDAVWFDSDEPRLVKLIQGILGL